MTLSTTVNKASYAGDGTTVSFAIPFLFLENGHIEAVLRDSTGAETTWALNTQFTLTGAGAAAGGTLAVSVNPTDFTPATGDTLVIRRVVPETQETDYPEGGAFPASAHEQALDKLTMLVQQHSEEIARVPALPVSSPLAGILVPEPGASELIRWNAAGAALETVAIADLALGIPASIGGALPGDMLTYTGAQWENRRPGVIDVRDFGATGDGATDDTAAIQAAASSLTAGGTLFFPQGTYLTSSAIALSSNTVLLGAGDASHIRTATDAINVFDIKGTVAASVDLASNAAAEQADVVLTDGSSFSAGDDVLIVGATAAGATRNVEINRVASVAANTLTFERDLYDAYNTADGAFVQKLTPKENVAVRDLKIAGPGVATGRFAFDIDYAKHVTFDNVTVEDTLGIFAEYCESVTVRNSRLRNCSGAVSVEYTKFAKVLDCHLDKSVSGVVIYRNSDGALVRGNTVKNMSGVPLQANFYSQDAVFDGNHVSNFAGGYGILADNASDRTKVTNNTVRYGTNVGIAITDVAYTIVSGNHVSDVGIKGIGFEGSSYCRCIGNLVENVGTTTSHHAIVWDSSTVDMSHNICSGNVCRDMTGVGIQWNGTGGTGTSNICTGNALEGVAFRGIELTGLDYTTLRSNSFEGSASIKDFLISDTQSLTTLTGDGHVTTGQMDLSGVDTGSIMFFMPPTDVIFYKCTVLTTEATSADDGVRVLVTSQSGGGGGAIIDFAAGAGSLLKNLPVQSGTIFVAAGGSSEAIKNDGDMLANDPMYYRCFGGKTGTGEITLQLDYITLGSS